MHHFGWLDINNFLAFRNAWIQFVSVLWEFNCFLWPSTRLRNQTKMLKTSCYHGSRELCVIFVRYHYCIYCLISQTLPRSFSHANFDGSPTGPFLYPISSLKSTVVKSFSANYTKIFFSELWLGAGNYDFQSENWAPMFYIGHLASEFFACTRFPFPRGPFSRRIK